MEKTNCLCCLGDWMKQKNQAQHEVSNASQQEDKTNNNPFPHNVVIPGSSISQDLNTPPKYPLKFNILDGNNIHNGIQ
jgi:hypothetical protein